MKQVENLIRPCLALLEEALQSETYQYNIESLKNFLQQRGKRFYITLSCISLGFVGLFALLNHQPQATAESPEKLENQAISRRIHDMSPRELAKLIDTVNEDLNHQVLYRDDTEASKSTAESLTDPMGPQEEVSLLSLAEGEVVGRADPFSPLVQDSTLTGGSTPSASPLPGMDLSGKPLPPKDVLEDIDFVGLIDEKNPAEKVAILKINDPDTGVKTVVKKLGESFTYDNHRIVLKKINRYQLSLAVNGKLRSKSLSPFVDNLKVKDEEVEVDEKETESSKNSYGEDNNATGASKASLKGLQE